MLIEYHSKSQHMPYPDLFVFCSLDTMGGFSRVKTPILFYQAANATKYIRKRKFNRLHKIFPFKVLKSKESSPHMYAALTHLSAEYFMDLQ